MAAEPTRTPVEAEELWLLLVWLEVCEELGLEFELELDWLAELEELALALATEDEAEAEAEATDPDAVADDDEEPDWVAAEAAETILPKPQGIAGPSGCLA
ncbi:hypothetical protein PHSY_007049 [Pseudozyma hubeiensis SY62]|uniref:Uncharacterized protein n=1 Tax=Pseudozyma hubeiensis (strain SY62) TaxID=1305764 RepID=R9PDJ1_PSEHS|nr:hypothetical protein PHSY_007049 [Pseudozyma hubeiensis SY62]GAC99448.1 hypothetical protein PHSY_007049 [Pseudozyma hubeiensis SY62]